MESALNQFSKRQIATTKVTIIFQIAKSLDQSLGIFNVLALS